MWRRRFRWIGIFRWRRRVEQFLVFKQFVFVIICLQQQFILCFDQFRGTDRPRSDPGIEFRQ